MTKIEITVTVSKGRESEVDTNLASRLRDLLDSFLGREIDDGLLDFELKETYK
jgi:hypothetical protein